MIKLLIGNNINKSTDCTLIVVRFEGVKSAEPPIISDNILEQTFRTSSDRLRVAACLDSYILWFIYRWQLITVW